MEKIYLTTPVARLVAGSVDKPRTKDFEGNPLIYTRGDKMGQPRVDYFVALALPKGAPGVQECIDSLRAYARSAFGAMADSPNFSWKIIDGDSAVKPPMGKQAPAEKTGYPGNWVLHCSSGYPAELYDERVQPTTGGKFKCGHFVRASIQVSENGSKANPGIFLSAQKIQWCAFGDEISSGPSAQDVFGAAPTSLPAGASTTPQGAPPVPQAAPPAPPVPQVAAPTPPPAPPVAPPVVPARYNIGGTLFEEADLLSKGWTLDALKGYPRA